MNLRYLLLFAVLISFTGYSQNLKKSISHSASFHSVQNVSIMFNSKEISIKKDGEEGELFKKDIAGKKVYKKSPAENYFYIANFAYNNSKNSFPVNVFIFNNSGEFVREYIGKAFFDMPHEIYDITDEGILYSFNPFDYKFSIIGVSGKPEEIILKPGAEFEMERGAFIGTIGKSYFVITSDKPIEINDNSNDASIYIIESETKNVEVKQLPFALPTAVFAENERLLVGGVKFENSLPKPILMQMDKDFNLINSNAIAAEKIIKKGDDYYIKGGSAIYRLNQKLEITDNYNVSGRWIRDIAAGEKFIAAYSGDANGNYITVLSEKLNLLRDGGVELNVGDIFMGIEEYSGGIKLNFENHTYIYNN
jgi:hypothetical protein